MRSPLKLQHGSEPLTILHVLPLNTECCHSSANSPGGKGLRIRISITFALIQLAFILNLLGQECNGYSFSLSHLIQKYMNHLKLYSLHSLLTIEEIFAEKDPGQIFELMIWTQLPNMRQLLSFLATSNSSVNIPTISYFCQKAVHVILS